MEYVTAILTPILAVIAIALAIVAWVSLLQLNLHAYHSSKNAMTTLKNEAEGEGKPFPLPRRLLRVRVLASIGVGLCFIFPLASFVLGKIADDAIVDIDGTQSDPAFKRAVYCAITAVIFLFVTCILASVVLALNASTLETLPGTTPDLDALADILNSY